MFCQSSVHRSLARFVSTNALAVIIAFALSISAGSRFGIPNEDVDLGHVLIFDHGRFLRPCWAMRAT